MDARKRAHCGAFRDFERLSSRLNSTFEPEFQPKSLIADLAVHFPCQQGIYREISAIHAIARLGRPKICRALRAIAANSLCSRAGKFLDLSRENELLSSDCSADFRDRVCDPERFCQINSRRFCWPFEVCCDHATALLQTESERARKTRKVGRLIMCR